MRKHHKSGKSQRQIAEYLNNKNIPAKRGGKWSGTTIGRVLEGLYPKKK
ncbi:MAG: recombinase family protein [Dolichospermum sp.]